MRHQLAASTSELQKIQLDVNLLLRIRKGIIAEAPASVAELQEPFDFSDSCLVSRGILEAYKQDIISGGRQKLRVLESIKVGMCAAFKPKTGYNDSLEQAWTLGFCFSRDAIYGVSCSYLTETETANGNSQVANSSNRVGGTGRDGKNKGCSPPSHHTKHAKDSSDAGQVLWRHHHHRCKLLVASR